MGGQGRSVVCLIILAAGLVVVPARGEAPSGEVSVVKSRALSPLAASGEVARRYLSPVVFDRLQRFSEKNKLSFQDHDVAVEDESFDLSVPAVPPEAGFGLIVFIPPIEKDVFTYTWRRELARRGFVLISPRRSGNEENVLKRRIPLALHAYEYATSHYRIVPERVFLAGFSGGSRVALRVAAGYPDVFRGALLIGGSDPFGEAGFVPPPAELMRLFQTRTRLVFASGQADTPNRAKDSRTRKSMDRLCVQGMSVAGQPRLGHWVPDEKGVRRALNALESPVPQTAEASACLSKLAQEVEQALIAVDQQLNAHGPAAVKQPLADLDDRFGGLAAPRTVELARLLDAEGESLSE